MSTQIQPRNDSPVLHLENVNWCILTPVGLKVLRPVFSLAEWEKALPPLTVAEKGSQFGLGDWLLKGEARHGDKTAQAIDAHNKTGVKVKTLMEYRRVSEKMPYPTRVENVSWTLHRVVADNAPPEEHAGWLQLAAEHDWTEAQALKFMRGPQAATLVSSGEFEIERLNGPEAVAWLEDTDKVLRDRHAAIPENLPSLRILIRQVREKIEWQKERTIARDCDAILEMFTGENYGERKGSPCAEVAPDNDIFWWTYKVGYHMTDEDRKARFKLLLDKKILCTVDMEDSRKEGQKGAMTVTYGLSRLFQKRCREIAFADKNQDSVIATRKAIQEFMGRETQAEAAA